MKQLSIKPLADRVVVEFIETPEVTKGGIIIPNSAKERPLMGIIVAVGPGHKDQPLSVKLGDTILFGTYAGSEIEVEGGTYHIMRETDIFAIIEDDGK